MNSDKDPFESQEIKRLQLFFYLTPIIGFFPSIWTLYRGQGSREQQAVSRLSITLALAWLSAYILLGAGAQMSELFTLRLLFINTLLTSGYFGVSVWLMFRLSKRQTVKLPGFSRFAERVVGRYLP